MAKLVLMLSAFLALKHEALSQILRQPLGLLNQPLAEAIIESPRQYIQQLESPGQYLQQFESPRLVTQQIIEPYNNIIPTLITPNVPIDVPNFPNNVPNCPINVPNCPINVPNCPINVPNFPINVPNFPINVPNFPINVPNFPINVPNFPINVPNTLSTTLITDCTPSVCNNLINTIQLMIVSNLLQNKKGKDEIALPPGPFLNELVAPSRNPVLRSSFSPNLISPRLIPSVTSNVVPSNILSGISPNGQIDRGVLTNVFKLLGNGLLI